MRGALLQNLLRDRRGNTVVEFAMVAPVMLILMMGLGDLLYQSYVLSVLDGAVQKAGRDSTIQGAANNVAGIDGKVVSLLGTLVNNPQQSCVVNAPSPSWCSVRRSYTTYSNVKPEKFTDTNRNGRRDNGECFDDVNGNRSWDADPGLNGQGGADDIALYTFSLKYRRLFPVASLIGWPEDQTVTSRTALKNQPYASQNLIPVVTVC